jgi:hypothetical protein
MRPKFCGGGELVAHSSAPARPRGVAGRLARAQTGCDVDEEDDEAGEEDLGADAGKQVQPAPAGLGDIGVGGKRIDLVGIERHNRHV